VSIWVTIITGTPTTFRLSGESGESGGNPFEGRLLNTPQVEAQAKASDQGNPVRQVSLAIRNEDAWIDLATEELWGASVQIAVDGVTETWTGTIKRFSEDGRGVLAVEAAEDVLAVFKRPMPDEVIRIATYTDVAREAVNSTVPTVFGGTSTDPIRIRAQLVDRVNFRYLICVGEIRQVVTILKDRETLAAGFTAYTGTSGQATYPGFAYLEFAADPRDSAGRWPEILVDVVGLKLGASTEAQCRNPARILQYLLTTADTGACGWGLGVAAGDLEAASWAQAITDCDTFTLKADGALFEQRPASIWINELLKACRGALTFESGKWVLRIDQISASVKTFDADNMELLDRGKGASSERINRVVLDYRYDPTEGTLLSSQTREDATSQAAIGVNERRESLLMVRDHTTAGKVADYWLRSEQYGEDRLRLRSDELPAGLRPGQVITIDRTDKGYSSALFRVERVRPGDFVGEAEARAYSDSIFDNDAPATSTDPATDPNVPGPDGASPPAVPAGLSLATGVTIQADGTALAYVEGTYTPGALALFTAIEYGAGAAPGSWSNLTHDQTGLFRVNGLPVGVEYTFRLTSVNTGGSSSPITGTITTAADVTAPGTPVTPTLTVLFKSVRVRCFQNLTKAADLAGFKVFRHTADVSGSATEVGFAPCAGNEDGVTFLDETTSFGATYYYWTKAVDKSGNASGFSATAGPVTTLQIIAGDVATGAINSSTLFASGVVDACAIADCAVTGVKTCLASINRANGCLNDGVVATATIINGAVTACKTCLAALCATTGCIVAGHVGTVQIADGAVTACKTCLAALCNTTGCVVAGHVGTVQIADGAVTACKTCLAALCNTTGCVVSGHIGCVQLADGAVTAAKTALVALCNTTGCIVANHIGCVQLADNAVCNAKIAAGAVSCAKIAANAIYACHITADAIIACHICTNAVTSDAICANAVTAGAICTGAVTSDKIAANAVTASKIAVYNFGGNLVPNGDAEEGNTCGWAITYGGGTVSSQTTCYSSGARAFQVCQSCYYTMIGYSPIPVVPGEVLVVSYRGKVSCVTSSLMFYMNYCACNPGVPIPYVGAGCVVGGGSCAASTSWQNLCAQFTVPAGMYWVTPNVYWNNGSANCYCFWFDNFEVRKIIDSVHIANGAVVAATVAADAIIACHLCTGAVTADAICANAVTSVAICANSIQSGHICANAVTAGAICTNAIISTKICAGAVLAAAIAADAIIACHICAGAVTADAICANAVTAAAICANAVTSAHICANAVTAGAICANAITSTKICAGAVLAAAVAADAIIACHICTGAVTADAICANAVTAAAICTNAVTADKICTNAVIASKICAGAICAGHICAGAITANAIAADAIITCHICTGAVTADAIAANAIVAAAICAGAVGANAIAAGVICGCHLVASTITGAKIAGGTITASHLLVGPAGAALNSDPGFMDADAWSTQCGGCCAVIVCDNYMGGKVLRSCPGCKNDVITDQYIPVSAGKSYRFHAYIRNIGAYCTLNYIYYNTYKSDCTLVSADSVLCCSAATTWTEVAGIKTIAAGVGFIKIRALLNWAPIACGSVEMTDVRVEEALPSTLIEDGAITTAKITANAITSGLICAGAITSAHICTSGLCADCITTGTMSADRISTGTLCASVALCSCSGCIGGYSICGAYLNAACGPNQITMQPYSIYTSGPGTFSMHGQMYWNQAWKCAIGFSVEDRFTAGCPLAFGAGMASCTCSVTLPSGTVVACCKPFFYVGSGATDYVQYYNGTLNVRGVICADSGTFTGTVCASAGSFASTASTMTPLITLCNSNASVNCYPALCVYSKSYTAAEITVDGNQAVRAVAGACIGMAGCANCLCGAVGYATCCFGVYGCAGAQYGGYFYAPLRAMAACGACCTIVGTATCCYAVIGCAPATAGYFCSSGNYGVDGIAVCVGVYGNASCYCGVHGTASSRGGDFVASVNDGVVGTASYYGVHGVGNTCCAVIGNTAYGVVSQRQMKVGLRPACVLADLRNLPIYRYRYHDRNLRGHSEHIGPMSEDFQEVFRLSFGNDMIPQTDGIALAGVKELDACVEAQARCICGQADCICSIVSRLSVIEATLRRCA